SRGIKDSSAMTVCLSVPLGKTVKQNINVETAATIYMCKSAVNLARGQIRDSIAASNHQTAVGSPSFRVRHAALCKSIDDDSARAWRIHTPSLIIAPAQLQHISACKAD